MLPEELKDGVIFHKGSGAVLYNFRGFHLALKDNRFELLMAHTAPENAIIRYAKTTGTAQINGFNSCWFMMDPGELMA